jgi:outer membrane protein TolC
MFKTSSMSYLFAITLLLSNSILSASENSNLDVLDEVLKIAAEKSPIMLAEDLKIAQVDASRLRGKSTYLPKVDANYDIGGFHEVRKSIDSNEANRVGARYTIRATHPIYHWGAVNALRQLGFSKEASAQLDAKIQYAELCVSLRKDFFKIVSDKAELVKMTKEIEYSASNLEKVNIAYSKGQSIDSLVAQEKIKHQALEIKKTYFQNQLMLDIAKFQNDSGDKDFNLDKVPSSLPDLKIEIEKLKSDFQAFKNTGFDQSLPTLLAKESQESIKNSIIEVRAKELPTFDFGVGMTQGPYENSNGKYELQTIFFTGITGSWTLFDRAETSDNLRSLNTRKRLVDTQLDVARNRLLTEAQGYLNILEIGMQSISLRKQNMEVLSQAADIAQLKYDKGQTDLEELYIEKQKATQAEFELIKDKADILTAYYAFRGSLFADSALKYYDPYKRSSM